MCNERETYIRKATGDNTNEFKVRINQHISDCKTGVSARKLLHHDTIVVLKLIA